MNWPVIIFIITCTLMGIMTYPMLFITILPTSVNDKITELLLRQQAHAGSILDILILSTILVLALSVPIAGMVSSLLLANDQLLNHHGGWTIAQGVWTFVVLAGVALFVTSVSYTAYKLSRQFYDWLQAKKRRRDMIDKLSNRNY